MQSLKELRIELGLTQDSVADRANNTGRFRKGFSRHTVLYVERGIGLGSVDTIEAIAAGLGLSLAQLRSYMRGDLSLAQAVATSTVKPDPDEVARLREADAKRDRRRESEERLPNLRATLDWCHGQFPDDFVLQIGRKFMQRTTDMARGEWFEMIKGRFYDWRARQDTAENKSVEQTPPQRTRERRKKAKGAQS